MASKKRKPKAEESDWAKMQRVLDAHAAKIAEIETLVMALTKQVLGPAPAPLQNMRFK